MIDNILDALKIAYSSDSKEKFKVLLEALEPPDFFYFWVHSALFYENIPSTLDDLKITDVKKHVVLWQSEEDWFRTCNYSEVRNNIKNHPNWTDKSFIITNSRQDKEQTRLMGINAVCRPMLFDLITYRPYDQTIVSHTNITHHTGNCWDRVDRGRLNLWNLFNQYRDKIIIAKLGKSFVHDPDNNNYLINNLSTDLSTDPTNLNTAFQYIESDAVWMNCTAFGAVVETRYSRVHGTDRLHVYTPTTSEKLYRNMHFLRPAVVCGGQHTRQYLIDLGFDTWDWFVDWSFDSEPDDEIRFEGFLQEVDRLLNTPLDILVKLINLHRDKLEYNRDRLFWLIDNYDTIDI